MDLTLEAEGRPSDLASFGTRLLPLAGSLAITINWRCNKMEIPDIDKAQAVLIGGVWTVIKKATPAENGWTLLELPSYVRINVRTDSIAAIRFTQLPKKVEVPSHLWNIG